jgi:hypothetical protein
MQKVRNLRESMNKEKEEMQGLRKTLMTMTDPYENRNNYIYSINVKIPYKFRNRLITVLTIEGERSGIMRWRMRR